MHDTSQKLALFGSKRKKPALFEFHQGRILKNLDFIGVNSAPLMKYFIRGAPFTPIKSGFLRTRPWWNSKSVETFFFLKPRKKKTTFSTRGVVNLQGVRPWMFIFVIIIYDILFIIYLLLFIIYYLLFIIMNNNNNNNNNNNK